MPHVAQRATNLIIGKSLITAETVMQELRDRLVVEMGESIWMVSQDELLRRARDILFLFEPLIAENLQSSDLAAWIAGYDQVARQLPNWSLDLFWRAGLPPRPPRIAIPGLFGGGDEEPKLRFPLLDKAMQSLLDRNILTREQFDELSAEAKVRAFTIAGDMEADTIATIRDVLAEDVREGTSLSEFRERLGEQLEGSFLGPAHLETVYRTNVQAAFRDGRESLASHPIVQELFPYQEYLPIDDTRVRSEHEALGSLGIDGTGVYRREDPIWDLFTPPWDFNCRCGVNLLTIDKAARKGVVEAQRWAETAEKPPFVSRLPFITFRPPAGFGTRGHTTVGIR